MPPQSRGESSTYLSQKRLFDGLLNPKKWEYPEITTAAPRGDLEAGVSVFSREEKWRAARY
jgi:hypothetical protein